MSITVDREVFLAAVQRVRPAIAGIRPKGAGLMRVWARDGMVHVSASNGKLSLRSRVPAATGEPPGFDVFVPARPLRKFVKAATEKTLDLSVEGERLCVVSGDSQLSLCRADPPPTDVRSADEGEGDDDDPLVAVPAHVLRGLLERTVFAAAAENTRYAVNGVLLEAADGGGLRVTATDGKRLAIAAVGTGPTGPSRGSGIVPPRALEVVLGLLAEVDCDHAATVRLGADQVVVDLGETRLVAGLVVGSFPKIADIMPCDPTIVVELDSARLADAVERVRACVDRQQPVARCVLHDNRLVLESVVRGCGEVSAALPAAFDGDRFEIGLGATYLAQTLAVWPDETVTLELTDPKKPALLRCAGYTYVLMPVALPDREPSR